MSQTYPIFENEDLNIIISPFDESSVESIFYFIGKHQFCTTIENGSKINWYWCKITSTWKRGKHTTYARFGEETVAKFYKIALTWAKNVPRGVDRNDELIEKIDQLYKKIQNRSHFNIDSRFYITFNTNRNIIRFENGVYDLETCKLREVKSDDYTTLSCGYVLLDKVNDDTLQSFLTGVFENDDVLNYVMLIIAAIVCGDEFKENIIFQGSGKSRMCDFYSLLGLAFGDYGKFRITSGGFLKFLPKNTVPSREEINCILLVDTEKVPIDFSVHGQFIYFPPSPHQKIEQQWASIFMWMILEKWVPLFKANGIPSHPEHHIQSQKWEKMKWEESYTCSKFHSVNNVGDIWFEFRGISK